MLVPPVLAGTQYAAAPGASSPAFDVRPLPTGAVVVVEPRAQPARTTAPLRVTNDDPFATRIVIRAQLGRARSGGRAVSVRVLRRSDGARLLEGPLAALSGFELGRLAAGASETFDVRITAAPGTRRARVALGWSFERL